MNPVHAPVVLQLPKVLLPTLYSLVNALSYKQSDCGKELDKGFLE